VIPDEAVEAAGEAIRDLWDSGEPVTPEMEARAALEAAAPHLMAPITAELMNAPASNYEEDNYDAGYIAGLAFALDAVGASSGDD
jgi:hypothetical protein